MWLIRVDRPRLLAANQSQNESSSRAGVSAASLWLTKRVYLCVYLYVSACHLAVGKGRDISQSDSNSNPIRNSEQKEPMVNSKGKYFLPIFTLTTKK